MALKILVVDDAIMYRILLKELLDILGHEVVGEAGTGAQAIERYAVLRPDVVTLDVSLPDMDGIAVLRELRVADPQAKVIMVSGNDQDVVVAQARQSGALGLIVKPVNKDKLAQLLDGIGKPS